MRAAWSLACPAHSGRLDTPHPHAPTNAPHHHQVDACGPYIEQYGKQRLPKYTAFLEACLKWNGDLTSAAAGQTGAAAGGGAAGAAAGGFLVGQSLTAADLCAWHYLCALEQHYGSYYESAMASAPRLRAFKEAVGGRPRIKTYLESERCPPWDADSLM